MISIVILSSFVVATAQGATPSAADSHNPPTRVSGIEVRAAPVIPTPATLEKKLKTEGDAVICKRKQVNGSRMPGGRICATNAEWADLSYQDQVSVRIQQSRTPM